MEGWTVRLSRLLVSLGRPIWKEGILTSKAWFSHYERTSTAICKSTIVEACCKMEEVHTTVRHSSIERRCLTTKHKPI